MRVAALLVVLSAPALAEAIPCPPRDAPVADHAKVLETDASERIAAICRKLEEDLHAPLLVVTIRSIRYYGSGDETIEQLALNTVREWKNVVESDSRDWTKAVLVLLSVQDRRCRIELGESYVSGQPEECRWILDGWMVPRFREGDYAGGIEAGVREIDGMVRGRGNTFEHGIPYPALDAPVTDHAKVLDGPAYARINTICRQLEEDQDKPLLVVTIRSIREHGGGDETLQQFARRTLREWRHRFEANRRDWSRAILVLVVVDDHKSWIEGGDSISPGTTLECRAILDGTAAPRFREGDYAGGLEAGLREMDDRLRGWTRKVPKKPVSWMWIAGPALLVLLTGVSLVRNGTKGVAWIVMRAVLSFLGQFLAALAAGSGGSGRRYYRGASYSPSSPRSSGGSSYGGGSYSGGSSSGRSYSGGGSTSNSRGATGSW